MSCYGCRCNHCLYNCELEPWYFAPGEVENIEDICYCCDECKHYTGNWEDGSKWRAECEKYREPIKRQQKMAALEERRAQIARENIRILNGGEKRGTDEIQAHSKV